MPDYCDCESISNNQKQLVTMEPQVPALEFNLSIYHMYKIVHDLVGPSFNMFFVYDDVPTRSNG